MSGDFLSFFALTSFLAFGTFGALAVRVVLAVLKMPIRRKVKAAVKKTMLVEMMAKIRIFCTVFGRAVSGTRTDSGSSVVGSSATDVSVVLVGCSVEGVSSGVSSGVEVTAVAVWAGFN